MPSLLRFYRKMKCTWTSSSNLSQRPFTGRPATSTRWSPPCRCWKSNSTFTNSSVLLHTSTRKASVTVILSLKISCLTRKRASWNFAISGPRRSLLRTSPTSHTSVLVITELPSWSLAPLTIQQRSVRSPLSITRLEICYFPPPPPDRWLTYVCAPKRCLVHWLCDGRVDAGTAAFPWRVRYWPAGGNHQSIGYPKSGTDPNNEPQLHGTSVPSNQAASIQQSMSYTSSTSTNLVNAVRCDINAPCRRSSRKHPMRPLIWSRLCWNTPHRSVYPRSRPCAIRSLTSFGILRPSCLTLGIMGHLGICLNCSTSPGMVCSKFLFSLFRPCVSRK